MKTRFFYEIDNERPVEKKKFIRKIFDSIVPTYDFLNRALSLGIDKGWRKFLVKRAGDIEGKLLLDLCCGTGDLTRLLRYKKGDMVSLDFSIPMLERGKNKGWLGNKVIAADASCLPFKNESFHSLTIAFGIRNIPDIDCFLIEALRVLKPHGKLLILELTRPTNPVFHIFYRFYLGIFVPIIGGIISGKFQAYRYLSGTISTFIDSMHLIKMLKEKGFLEIRSYKKTFGIATVFECIK